MFSGIDLRSIMNETEIQSSTILDSIAGLKVIPRECFDITRRKKRMNVSKGGKGRNDHVNMVAGERDHQRGSGMMDKIKTGIGIKPKE